VFVSGSSRTTVGAIAAATLVAGAIVGAVIGRRTVPVTEAPVAQFVIELPDSMTAVNRCCGPSQLLSRDGSTLVFVGMRGSTGALFRRSIGQLDAEKIAGTEEATSPALSPDGRWVSFEVGGQLKKVPLNGGPVVPIANVGQVAGATWVSNDTILFSNNTLRGSLWLVGASGGQPISVPALDSAATYRYPTVLPGGRHALVQWRARFRGALEEARIVTVELKTGHVDTIGVGAAAQYAMRALVVATSDGTILVQNFDPDTRRTVGPATALPGRASVSGGVLPEFAVSENGWLEYEVARGTGGGETLRIIGGTRDTPLALESTLVVGNFEDVAIAPDGNRILVRSATGSGGSGGDLWMLDVKAGTRARFTVGGGDMPVWSRDGRSVAYYWQGDATNKPGIYVRPVDQTSAPHLVLAGPGLAPNSWTPDGRTLAFATAGQGGASDIGLVTLGDTAPSWILRAPEFNERQPQISWDGTRLAYSSNRTGRSEVYVQAMSGDAVPVPISTNGGSAARWARDGRTLFYIDPVGQVHAVTIPPGPGIAVTSRTIVSRAAASADLNNSNVNWDVFPDGKRMLIIDAGGGIGTRRMALFQNWPAFARSMGAKQ
jgi:Tol biopolymer transport system component